MLEKSGSVLIKSEAFHDRFDLASIREAHEIEVITLELVVRVDGYDRTPERNESMPASLSA